MNHSDRSVQAAGSLDESFADSGIFRLALDSLEPETLLFGLTAAHATGHLYFTGKVQSGVTHSPYLLGRLLVDGTLDNRFGTNGVVTGFFAGTNESQGNAVSVLSDGKILVTGSVGGARDPALARYLPDGTPDVEFGMAGHVVLPRPQELNALMLMDVGGGKDQSVPANVLPLDNGKILIVNSYVITHLADTRAFIFQLNNDGSLDTSFNDKGYVQVIYPGADPADVKVHGGLIDQDGNIVVCGQLAPRSGTSAPLFARYGLNGSLDQGFGNGGFVIVSVSESARLVAIIQQPNNRLLGIGRTETPQGLLIGLEPDGSANIQFNRGQPLLTRLNNEPTYWASGLMQPDGKIVLIGKQLDETAPAVVARILSDGSFDTTFAGIGWVGTDVGGRTTFYAVTLQKDGKIVVAGTGITPEFQGQVLRLHGLG